MSNEYTAAIEQAKANLADIRERGAEALVSWDEIKDKYFTPKEIAASKLRAEQGKIVIVKPRRKNEHIPLAERLKDWNGQPYESCAEDKEWFDLEPVGDEEW